MVSKLWNWFTAGPGIPIIAFSVGMSMVMVLTYYKYVSTSDVTYCVITAALLVLFVVAMLGIRHKFRHLWEETNRDEL